MPRRHRTRKSDAELAREIQNLTDEMPARVKISKHDAAKAEGYDQGYSQGVSDANKNHSKTFEILKAKFDEVVAIHNRERAELIDEFSQAIFKLGVNSRGPQE